MRDTVVAGLETIKRIVNNERYIHLNVESWSLFVLVLFVKSFYSGSIEYENG
jgi:hypothetical protein